MHTVRRFLLVITSLAIACPTVAQETSHRISLGASFSGLGLYDETGRPKTSTGISGWINVGVTAPLSVETRVSWFPTSESVERQLQGGKTFKLMAGARGMLMESRRFTLSGILQPGMIRFSNTVYHDASGNDAVGPQTHFAMDLGGTLELFSTLARVASVRLRSHLVRRARRLRRGVGSML